MARAQINRPGLLLLPAVKLPCCPGQHWGLNPQVQLRHRRQILVWREATYSAEASSIDRHHESCKRLVLRRVAPSCISYLTAQLHRRGLTGACALRSFASVYFPSKSLYACICDTTLVVKWAKPCPALQCPTSPLTLFSLLSVACRTAKHLG